MGDSTRLGARRGGVDADGGGEEGAEREGAAEEDPEPDCEEEGEGDVGVAAVRGRHFRTVFVSSGEVGLLFGSSFFSRSGFGG